MGLHLLLLSVSVLFTLAPAQAQDGGWPRTLTDGLGNEVTIAASPQRIVSVNLGADEVLLSLVEPERVLAVTAFAQDPAISNVAVAASQIETTIAAADAELIISLEPDIVFVASFTDAGVVQQLRDAGLTVFTTGSPTGFDPIRENIRLLGQAVGEEEAAEALIAWMDTEIAAVSQAVARNADDRVRALYLTPGNYTSGLNSTISDIIAAAGGVDVAAAAGIAQFAPVSDEFIIEQDPDVILLSGWTPWDPTFVDTFMTNPTFAGLSAVQDGRTYVTNEAHLTTVSHFIAEGVKDVAAYLYPEVYPAFPVTFTDAAGNLITVEEKPDVIIVPPSERIDSAQDRVLTEINNPALQVLFRTSTDDDLTREDVDLVFLREPVEGLDNAVLLYPGETPAEDVANMMLMGVALGERVAALNAIAIYTDQLEAIARGDL